MRQKIGYGLLSMVESFVFYSAGIKRTELKTENSTKAVQGILPKEKFAVKFANLLNHLGLTRYGVFYQCAYDLGEIKAAADTEPLLRIAIKKYKELMFKAGYTYKSENEKAIDYLEKRFRIMSYMIDEPVERLWRGIVYDLIKFSNAFLIKTRGKEVPFINAKGITKSQKPVIGYARVDPEQIQIKFDENGKIVEYKQIVNYKEKTFKPEDVIHFTFDRNPGSVWGVPRWIAVLEDLKILRKLEGHVMQLVYRYAMPFIHMIIGKDIAGMEGTQKEVLDAKADMERSPSDSMVITTNRTEFKVVGSGGDTIDVNPYLLYFLRRIFAGMNVSESMMGLGGTAKQDADSMEEQVHNAVKDNQSVFALQFQHEVINEILLEGGFNPILNEKDIVNLVFNEINLDTKIKMENHEVNKFQSNVITMEEMRRNLGLRTDNIDENRLFANMITQQNVLEQIDINHQNAIEIQQMQIDANEKLAHIAAAQKVVGNTSGGAHKATSSASYAKKNTGNGKSVKTKTTKTVKTLDAPKNQYGTFSAKVKEAQEDHWPKINASIFHNELDTILQESINLLKENKENKLDWKTTYDKMIVSTESYLQSFASAGAARALKDINKSSDSISFFENDQLKTYSARVLGEFINDIKKKHGNISDRNYILNYIESIKYRLDYFSDYVSKKSFWYSYIKTCAVNQVQEVKVSCSEGSRHKEHAGQLLLTRSAGINDIPGYSANCGCYLTPVITPDAVERGI